MPTCRLTALFLVAALLLAAPAAAGSAGPVQVELFEALPAGKELEPGAAPPVERYTEPAFGFVRTPAKYSVNALPLDRSTPFVLRASFDHALPAGEWEFRLRARGAARFLIDGKPVLATKPQKPNTSADDPVPPPPTKNDSPIRQAPAPHQDVLAGVKLDGGIHRFTLVAVIGGKGLYPTPGELLVSVGRKGEVPRLLGAGAPPRLTDAEWEAYVADSHARHHARDAERRRDVSTRVAAAWKERHARVRQWVLRQPAPSIPRGVPNIPVYNDIDRFLGARLRQAKATPTPLTSDLEFLRRLSLDVTGLIPTSEEIRVFLADPPPVRRRRAIDRFLSRPGWADHWVSYWQDVLAENPGILKPDLNNSGPFRWWLHQSFTDGVPFDRLVTELIEMEGSVHQGAPAAFSVASLNDAPMATKAGILSQAFLGQNLSCARCHDAPGHPFKQKDLYKLAAMLSGKPVTIPETATVHLVAGFRKPLVEVTTRPGEPIEPQWPFEELARRAAGIAPAPDHSRIRSRHQLAELIVSPENERFGQVIVNRIWRRYMGRGLVEPVDDWSGADASHPELLRYLAREFLLSGYDLKHVARLIFSSHAYQRRPAPVPPEESRPSDRLFAGPYRRRMSAEQLVDSLYRCTGKQFDSEELNLSPLGDKPPSQFVNLGVPCRAWEFTALSNERDRPALALPISQSIVDVLTAYGWRPSRQNAATVRDDGPTAMQALILANGIMGTRIVRLSDDSEFTELCLKERTLPALLRETFLRVLSRVPTAKESRVFQDYLRASFPRRIVPGAPRRESTFRTDRRVSWANHLTAEATVIRMEEERRLRLGDEPTLRLTPEFRERFEDVLWALVNSPEFVMIP